MYPVIYTPCYLRCCPIQLAVYYDFYPRSLDNQDKNSHAAEESENYRMRGKKNKPKAKITDPITLGALEYIKCYSPSVYNVLMNCSFIYEDAGKIVKKSLDEYFKDDYKKKKKQKDWYYYFYNYFYYQ